MADPTTKAEAMEQAKAALLARIPAVAKLAGVVSLTSPTGESFTLAPDALAQVVAQQQMVDSGLQGERSGSGGLSYSRARLRR
mgnify:FL=1